MNSLRLIPLSTLLFGLFAVGSASASSVPLVCRPDFQNLASSGSVLQGKNPAVTIIGGHINRPANAPASGAIRLTESSFGQPLAQWTPGATYAADVVAQVRAALYPAAGSTRTQVLASQAAFRYKALLFSPPSSGADVSNYFESINQWFGEADRVIAKAQIAILHAAIARAPFDTGLRNTLLDVYYDLAVAEMQFASKKLSELATMRLGFVQTGPFIIDNEIAAYESLVALVAGVLDQYRGLFCEPIDGVEPSDFDPDPTVRGMPMGYYLFIRSQKNRNLTASKYVDAAGIEKSVPTVNTPAPGQAYTAIPRPDNEVLFAGYKDYTTIYTIMGRYIQYQADLARLRGMRQAPQDLVKARNATSQMQSSLARDFQTLQGMFQGITFPPGDASGVNAAVSAVETALADITNVRAFLNGQSNLLGLDPNFLMLVQDNNPNLATGPRDSFDVLKDSITGLNRPLTVALDLMTVAESRYNTFRGSVDQVVTELDDLEENYQDRFQQITGYETTDVPGFNGISKPFSGSELNVVEQTIAGLNARNFKLGELGEQLDGDLTAASASVKEAEGLQTTFLNAKQTYINTTNDLYTNAQISAGVAAGVQAATDTAFEIAGVDGLTTTTALGGNVIAIGVAGAANTIAQTTNAVIQLEIDQQLDLAALDFETSLDASEAALTVNQAKQEVGAIKREGYAKQLETLDTTTQLAQAQAQKAALLYEVGRIEQKLASNSAAVRSKYYADPIHYIKAENALIDADESFRTAQRWVFYTQRALEYKWQQTFAITQGSKSWDSGSIFKLRNAKELNELVTQLVNWDAPRTAEILNSPTSTSFISLRDDVISPNPNQLNLINKSDPGVRIDWPTGQSVTVAEFFRRRLLEYKDANGFVRIPINTAVLETVDGNFFRGPDYLADGIVIPGVWRNKILSIKVNIIATDGGANPTSRPGSLIYGGNTFQRTRRPLRADRSRPSTGTGSIRDIAGEFTTAPFRYWESNNFDNLFVPRDRQPTSIAIAYSGATARNNTTGEDVLGDTFRNVAFAQRSVAATGWELIFDTDAPVASQSVDPNKITDIELIIRHRYSDRAQPN